MDTKKTEPKPEFRKMTRNGQRMLVSNVVPTTDELTSVRSNTQATGEKVKELEKQGRNMKRELNRQERKIKGISKECRNNTATNVDLKKDINNLRIITDHLDNVKINKTTFNMGMDEIMRKIKDISIFILVIYIIVIGIITTMIFM